MSYLGIVSDIAAILTAAVAGWAGLYFWIDIRGKRQRLEAYLKQVKDTAKDDDKGQRSILHLMARLGLTEAEILHASFRSSRIKRTLAADKDTGRADAMLLEYDPKKQARM